MMEHCPKDVKTSGRCNTMKSVNVFTVITLKLPTSWADGFNISNEANQIAFIGCALVLPQNKIKRKKKTHSNESQCDDRTQNVRQVNCTSNISSKHNVLAQ